jgi:uncharacterized membrane protein YeaQ/YmgE (transglycosylase-associated protein family)
MPSVLAESCLPFALALPVVATAAVDPQAATVGFKMLNVYAGIAGAVVAAAIAHKLSLTADDPNKPVTVKSQLGKLTRSITNVISGASASVFGSPFASRVLGMDGNDAAMMLSFVFGLIGSAICEAIVIAGPTVGPWIVELGKRAAGVPSIPAAAPLKPGLPPPSNGEAPKS